MREKSKSRVLWIAFIDSKGREVHRRRFPFDLVRELLLVGTPAALGWADPKTGEQKQFIIDRRDTAKQIRRGYIRAVERNIKLNAQACTN